MSTVDQHGHLAVEEIAEYADGLVTDPAALTVIESHLPGCERCRQVLADLGEISALLAAEDVPPIPAVVAIQMEATLAAEVHERQNEQRRLRAAGTDLPESVLGIPAVEPDLGSPAHSAGIGGGRATVPAQPRSLSEHRRRSRTVSALAAAATVTAFAIGAAIFTQGMSGSDQLSSGAGVVEPQGPEAAEDGARGTYTGPTPATGDLYLSSSGQTFTAYTLSTSAQLLLSQRTVRNGLTTGGETPAVSPEAPSNAPPAAVGSGGTGPDTSFSGGTDRTDLFSSAGLARCVAGLVPDPAAVQVLAVDLGQFDGQPAAMIVLSDPDDPATAQVRVVNARCGLDEPVEFLRTEIARS